MTKNKCYDCIHRREVPGSAHSACAHPMTALTARSAFAQLAQIVGKRGGPELMDLASRFDESPTRAMAALKIHADPYGVAHGWFVWPMNFDPTWLTSCEGFEMKAVQDAEKVS